MRIEEDRAGRVAEQADVGRFANARDGSEQLLLVPGKIVKVIHEQHGFCKQRASGNLFQNFLQSPAGIEAILQTAPPLSPPRNVGAALLKGEQRFF